MANITSILRDSLIGEIVEAQRFLKGTEVDEAGLRAELGKNNLFALAEASTYAREAVQLRQFTEAAIETRRMIEGQRRKERTGPKNYLS